MEDLKESSDILLIMFSGYLMLSFIVKFYLTAPHYQFSCVGQGIKQTYLYMYLSYPLFQAQWDRYDQRITKP
jgi:hypothetical protein